MHKDTMKELAVVLDEYESTLTDLIDDVKTDSANVEGGLEGTHWYSDEARDAMNKLEEIRDALRDTYNLVAKVCDLAEEGFTLWEK